MQYLFFKQDLALQVLQHVLGGSPSRLLDSAEAAGENVEGMVAVFDHMGLGSAVGGRLHNLSGGLRDHDNVGLALNRQNGTGIPSNLLQHIGSGHVFIPTQADPYGLSLVIFRHSVAVLLGGFVALGEVDALQIDKARRFRARRIHRRRAH